MGIAALQVHKMLRYSAVVLVQHIAPLLSRLIQTFPGTIMQSRIARKTDILLLNCAVIIDTGKL